MKKLCLVGTAFLVRVEGFEPSRRKTPDPKSGASAVPPHSHAEFYCNTAVFTESNILFDDQTYRAVVTAFNIRINEGFF